MNNQEFLAALRKGLEGLPQEDIERSVEFYAEMIADCMEDGATAEEAIADIGTPEEVVSQILEETSLPKLIKAKVKPRRSLSVLDIVLLILGAPLWIPLLIAVAAILFSIYVVIWSILIVVYAVNLSFAAGFPAGILASFTYIEDGNFAGCILFIGCGLVCGGLAILLFFGANQMAKGICNLSRYIWRKMKSCFFRKNEVL